jgi:glycosyltransferase involved in cell wall biosynthesis
MRDLDQRGGSLVASSEALSIVLPAKNEAINLVKLLPVLRQEFPDAEILVVNDGSTDDTVAVCEAAGVRVVSHRYSRGNGASIKTGARNASHELLVFMDGDGQHSPADVHRLLAEMGKGQDMVVGARSAASQASMGRLVANTVYNRLASWITGQQILDLTSGLRAVKRRKFLQFLYLLPNGFSYPTTITMAFFRAGYSVAYLPIEAGKREGKSHISLVKDGVRFFLIIFKVGTLYSPLKIFLPVAASFFLTGLGYYLYTYLTLSRFTNMSAVLFMTSVLVFLIGLVSEQVTALLYKDSD